MKEKNVYELEIGKDYRVHCSKLIVIDRTGDFGNKGFYDGLYKKDVPCNNAKNWHEAAEQEVIEAFKKHLVARYGKDWETMKIKEKHPNSGGDINDGVGEVEFSKLFDGWNVYNKNGLVYCNGIWVERLEEEEEPEIHIQDAIKANVVIHCETECEAERILNMAHRLGRKWLDGQSYENSLLWERYKGLTCYYLFDNRYCYLQHFKAENYTIIPSTQIADLEEKKAADWVPAPEDIEEIDAIEEIDKKAIENPSIDKVTTKNLDIALRMVGIQLDANIIGKVIDLVALIENKGDEVAIKDVVSLQQTW